MKIKLYKSREQTSENTHGIISTAAFFFLKEKKRAQRITTVSQRVHFHSWSISAPFFLDKMGYCCIFFFCKKKRDRSFSTFALVLCASVSSFFFYFIKKKEKEPSTFGRDLRVKVPALYSLFLFFFYVIKKKIK